jgi:hypothetical protein
MIELTKAQIDAIRASPEMRSLIAKSVGSDQMNARLDQLDDEQYATLYDVILDTFLNEAPIVEELLAEQGKGVFPIQINGVPGAYYVFAPEYDREGAFETLDEAQAYVDCNFGEYLINGDNPKDEGDRK